MKLKDIAGLLREQITLCQHQSVNPKQLCMTCKELNEERAELAEKDLEDYVVGEVCSCWWEMEEIPTRNCPTCKGTGVVLKAKQ